MGAERGAVPMTPHVVGVGERTRWRERPPDQVGAAVARMTQQIRRTKMKRNKLRWMAPLLALAFIATACGNDDDDTSTGDDGAAEPAGDDSESCIGEEGCVPANQPDVNGDGTVKIGVLSPGDTNDNGYYESLCSPPARSPRRRAGSSPSSTRSTRQTPPSRHATSRPEE